MLGWDAAAMMPPGGAAARGDQLAVLAGLAHGMLTAPERRPTIWPSRGGRRRSRSVARRQSAPDAPCPHARNRDAGRPGGGAGARELRLREGVARGAAQVRFRHGPRARSRRWCASTREAAAALAPALGLSPYDALMDGYQRGIGAADVAPVFAGYEAFLRDALPEAEARQARPARAGAAAGAVSRRGAGGAVPAAVRARSAWTSHHARLDRSAHPFCGGTPTDVRITTRYDEADFTQA